jgi:hypothetical protein
MSYYKGPATTFLHGITGGETGLKPLEWNSKPVCATEGCNSAAQGKSKYCRPHAREARAAWLDKVKASSEAREERKSYFADIWARAVAAARKAHAEAIPTPMTVVEKVGISNENTGRSYFVSEGACGFGSVKVRPGNSSFALWLVKNNYAHKSYNGGVSISTNYGSQSVARAEAAAYAMADVLREAGIKAYGTSNLD